ncbi:PREDICTED: uncharacterized protein LOC107331849 [Acropora digitifera]|uniref:uncharacterized protein LOC107331849 n=1 Tax=Acropora digitifera TaxID=70779 RepID=UPI00077B00A0|nr:PREDICTED: uncharacterized protein LOC107331849 [Acropora digitifera]
MPTHCCVPECTKKDCRDENGNKISYFKFPIDDPQLNRKWLHAIRRDEGKYFKVTEATKVCSRHFRPGDIKKTLAGKNELRAGVVPFLFAWIRASPRKREDPIARNFGIKLPSKVARKLNVSSVDLADHLPNNSANDDPVEFAESANGSMSFSCSVRDAEMQTEPEIGSDTELRQQALEQKSQLEIGTRLVEALQKQLFSVDKFKHDDSSMRFYTGFPNWRNLRPIDEYFAVITATDKTMSEDFKKKYSSTRVIIDCTEVRCQMPSSLQLNGELFSNYKHHTTLKGLIGISPGGAITFISQLYTGSISDREIVVRSGFLDLPFEDNDSVMADKGFTIQDLLPLAVSLNIPPFLGSSSQMPAEDVVKTQEIASLRIHVEHAINKIKNFHIWDGVIPLHQLGLVNQMWSVCAILCNAQPNIISI